MQVTNGRNCFLEHKKKKIELAKKMTNMTFSVMARSCNKMMIGKTFWKSVVLPGVFVGNAVLIWTEEEKQRLQRIENSVWRQLLGAPSYVAVEAY